MVLLVFFYVEVDGEVKCERWKRDDDSDESKKTWLDMLMGRRRKITLDWPYPFAEGKLFVLTLRAGMEGYHISVNGRHITSFPYRTVSSLLFLFVCTRLVRNVLTLSDVNGFFRGLF